LGYGVSLDGATLAVGRPDDGLGTVQFFERQSDRTWMVGAKVDAGSDAVAGAGFGRSVSLSGNRLLVGAPAEGGNVGAVYLFERPGPGGAWTKVAGVRWTGTASGDTFGNVVSLSGDRALVGASGDDSAIFNGGAAYMFERNPDGTWPTTGTRIIASDPAQSASFGRGVSVSGDRALIGAASGSGGGAYVFLRQSAGVWTLEQKLPNSSGNTSVFGHAVAIEGDRALVGAYGSNGAVYVFERQAGTWAQVARLAIPSAMTTGNDNLGRSVSLSGDLALAGAPGANRDIGPVTAGQVGTAFASRRQATGTWGPLVEVKSATTDFVETRQYGNVVSLSGSVGAISAHGDVRSAPPAGVRTGAVYVVDVSGLVP
jgi:hypothetical protein